MSLHLILSGRLDDVAVSYLLFNSLGYCEHLFKCLELVLTTTLILLFVVLEIEVKGLTVVSFKHKSHCIFDYACTYLYDIYIYVCMYTVHICAVNDQCSTRSKVGVCRWGSCCR